MLFCPEKYQKKTSNYLELSPTVAKQDFEGRKKKVGYEDFGVGVFFGH